MLRLHWSPDSANLPVRIALTALGLPFEGVRVNRAAGAQRSPAHLALNPQGLIPVLEDGPRAIFETGAILLHVAERAGRFGPDGPAAGDGGARAAVLPWLFWLSNTLHADLRIGFQPGSLAGEAHAGAVLSGIAARVGRHLALVEGELATGGRLGALPVGLLDWYLGSCLRWARLYPAGGPVLAGLDGLPRLAARLAAAEAAPAVRAACAAEAIPGARPFTDPLPPDLPAAEVTG